MLAKFLVLVSLALIQGRPQPDGKNHSAASANDLCPEDRSHYLLPHEYDCTKFYYCEYGLKWETPRDCAPGTVFSYEIQVCVHPAVANCNLPGVPPATEVTEPETEATTLAPSSTEASIISTTTSAPSSTEAAIISTSTAAPSTTEASIISTTTSAPSSTEASIISTSTAAPSTTEASIISTSTAAPSTTEASIISTTTSAPSSTEASIISTSTAAPSTTEASIISTSTAAPSTTEASIISTTTSAPSSTEASIISTSTAAPSTTEASIISTSTAAPSTTEASIISTSTAAPSTTEASIISTTSTQPPTITDAPTTPVEGGNGDLPNGCPSDFEEHKLLPHESNCNKFYYCVFGEKVERICAPGTYFNPEIQVCDWPWNVDCKNLNSEEDSSDNGTGDNNGSENGVLPNGCPADFDIHQLLPHESNCGKFYYCVFGETVERECASGLHFNPILQVCDWPENAGCESTDGADSGTEDNGNGNEDGGDGSEDSSELLPNGCPADFDIHQLLPHESNCGKFYYCVFGEKVERKCAPGLHFNPTLQVCDWPANAGCEISGGGDSGSGDGSGDTDTGNGGNGDGSGDTDTGNGGNGDGSGDTDTGNGSSEDGSGDSGTGLLPNGCPADFDIHQLLPHESNCGKFYYCVFGEKVERECAPGLHFNPTVQVCDWPANAGCELNGGGDSGSGDGSGDTDNGNGGSGDGSGDTDSGNGGSGDGSGDTDAGNGGSGDGSGDTDAGNGGSGDGSGDTDTGNGGSGDGSGDSGTELLPNGCPADFDIHQLLPHESDCTKFYHCVFGEKVERKCAPGLNFNPSLQVCDWPENAGCETNDNGGGNEDNNTTENGNSPDENNSNEAVDEPNNSKCAESCNVLPWPHETACDKFWRCEGNKAALVICAEGLHFNTNTGTCDFICNANCVRNYVQTTANAQGLKIFVPWDKIEDNDVVRTYVQ